MQRIKSILMIIGGLVAGAALWQWSGIGVEQRVSPVVERLETGPDIQQAASRLP